MRFLVGLLIGCAITGLLYQFLVKKDPKDQKVLVTKKYEEVTKDLGQFEKDQAARAINPDLENAGTIDPGFDYAGSGKLEVPDIDKAMIEYYSKAITLKDTDDSSQKLNGDFTGSITFDHGPLKGRVDVLQFKSSLSKENKELEFNSTLILSDPAKVEYARFQTQGENYKLKINKSMEKCFFIELDSKSFLYLDLTLWPRISGRFFGNSIGKVELSHD